MSKKLTEEECKIRDVREKEYQKKWKLENKKKIALDRKANYLLHKDELCLKTKTWRANNVGKYRETNRKYSKDHRKEYNRRYEIRDKEKESLRKKEYYKNHKEQILDQNKQWGIKNKTRITKVRSIYVKENKDSIALKNQEYFQKNINKILEYARIHTITNISDPYIAHLLKIPTVTLRQYPDFIKSYRYQLKTKRLLKQKKDEKTNNQSERPL